MPGEMLELKYVGEKAAEEAKKEMGGADNKVFNVKPRSCLDPTYPRPSYRVSSVLDGEFRQYRGSRDKDAFISFVEEKKWKQMEAVPGWKSPASIQMSIVSYFFKLSQVLRTVHNTLMEEYGLPTWGSYLIFAVATIFIGALLGLMLVCVIDLIYPPKPVPGRSSVQLKEKLAPEDEQSLQWRSKIPFLRLTTAPGGFAMEVKDSLSPLDDGPESRLEAELLTDKITLSRRSESNKRTRLVVDGPLGNLLLYSATVATACLSTKPYTYYGIIYTCKENRCERATVKQLWLLLEPREPGSATCRDHLAVRQAIRRLEDGSTVTHCSVSHQVDSTLCSVSHKVDSNTLLCEHNPHILIPVRHQVDSNTLLCEPSGRQ
uniref:Uncharacterized protein n=1 Tax=Timema poppense TaxID=170557 RepID=A0A7R9DHN0_TIMPO|nr:unnamed protein product [Timema poppensis]